MANQEREQFGQELQKLSNRWKQFSADYHSDEKLRARIDSGDVAPLYEALNADLPGDARASRPPEGVKVRVVADTDQEQYFVVPSDPSWMLRDSDMQDVSGGSSVGTAGSLGSAGTAITSSAPSTLSTGGTAGTGGCLQV